MTGSHREKSDLIGANLNLKKSEKNPNFGLLNDIDGAVSLKLLTALSYRVVFFFY